jgi:hypothetical protein
MSDDGWRAPTTAGDVWFKTSIASPLFVNEGVVMRTLAGLFPDHVPAPLAVEPQRGWMVLAGFGTGVGWDASLEAVEAVARTFARMQVEAAGHVDLLLAAGCHDRRLDRLAARAEAWLPEVGADGRLRARLRAAYLPAWSSFEPPDRLARAWELAVPLGALHQADQLPVPGGLPPAADRPPHRPGAAARAPVPTATGCSASARNGRGP